MNTYATKQIQNTYIYIPNNDSLIKAVYKQNIRGCCKNVIMYINLCMHQQNTGRYQQVSQTRRNSATNA